MSKASLIILASLFIPLYATANSDNMQGLNTPKHSVQVQIPSAEDSSQLRTLQLLKVIPSKEFKERNQNVLDELKYSTEKDYSDGIISFKKSGAKDLGMNSTPVLDQGEYSTCATFGLTGFLDSFIGKGDYIDQQCILALSRTIGASLWDGGWPDEIYSLIGYYGVVPKDQCFGKTYPNQQQYVYSSEYTRISDRKSLERRYLQKRYISIETIKHAIDSGNRVLLATMLMASQDPISVNGFNIKVDGDSKKGGGLWACEQPGKYTNYCTSQSAGHVLTIVGYDDNQKLLKIRNSWGAAYGDSGDYYMTYEFLRAMGDSLYLLN